MQSFLIGLYPGTMHGTNGDVEKQGFHRYIPPARINGKMLGMSFVGRKRQGAGRDVKEAKPRRKAREELTDAGKAGEIRTKR